MRGTVGKQLGGELYRMVARRRTHIGFAAFLAIELLVVYFLQKPGVKRFYEKILDQNGFPFDHYFSALTLGFIILAASVFILGALFLALVSGDIVAKEVEDGTMRMILSRPVTRLRVLLVKYAACLIYTFGLIYFLGVSAVGVGIVERGWGGGFFAFSPEHGLFELYDWWRGMWKFGQGLFFLSLSIATVTSFGFCLSCFRMKPAAATILTAAVMFIDFVVSKMPPLADYQHWFLTPRLDDWTLSLRDVVPWATLVKTYAFLFGIQATLFVIGWAVFQARDLKS